MNGNCKMKWYACLDKANPWLWTANHPTACRAMHPASMQRHGIVQTALRLLMVFVVTVGTVACSSSSVFQSTGNEKLDAVLEQAADLRGTPYCYAGNTPDCFDCSGFLQYCFLSAGISIPRTTSELYKLGTPVDLDDLETADLVFFATSPNKVSHVGLYLGHNSFIHSSTSSGVIISELSDPYWKPRYLGARRLP